ncbi:MAG: ATP-binding protein [Planctomycetia bacterium]|nr:ATP-binding protein [Planctomycetia bacterium]
MANAAPQYGFFTELARIINAGQSRSLLVTGNIHDLYFLSGENGGEYQPLVEFLCSKCAVPGLIRVVYELNGPIRILDEQHRLSIRNSWVSWRAAREVDDLALAALSSKRDQAQREMLENEFDALVRDAIGKPTVALELLRQISLCSRTLTPQGRPYLAENLFIVIEGADILLPAGDGDLSRLSASDRHRVTVVQDWFSDPGFMNADDSVILLAESRSEVHPRVARLPAVLSVEVPAPDMAARQHYIEWFVDSAAKVTVGRKMPVPKLWAGPAELAQFTAGLSVHALRQLLIGAAHSGETLSAAAVIAKVEDFIRAQLGDDVIEFKKPSHRLTDVVGFTKLKDFIQSELLPRFRTTGDDALSGAAVAGPIGGGKTFIFEAAASELDLPVLVLKNIRSQWFGQTDVIFERLRRVLEALVKAVIFVDEADTQFGGVGQDAHETERRLTGKIQQMMSDTKLRGRIIWLLMTARIHLLSPDIRRPGRVGDLIIPVLDPEGEDRQEFLRWVLKAVGLQDAAKYSDVATPPATATQVQDPLRRLDELTRGYSAASFASLRSHLKAKSVASKLELADVEAIVRDHIPPAIEDTRRYQTLQALVNCTRRSLLPDPQVSDSTRAAWYDELRALEARGIR